MYPSVFDKSINYQTLGQDASPVLDFDLQNALLFKGKSTVSMENLHSLLLCRKTSTTVTEKGR